MHCIALTAAIILQFVCFNFLGSAKVTTLLQEQWSNGKELFRNLIKQARHVSICMDGWTKKSLSSSFLGISCCFYDTANETVVHALLELIQVPHPHTGETIAKVVEDCVKEWGIPCEKILLIITDNGSNIIKAIRLLQESATAVNESTSASIDDDEVDVAEYVSDHSDDDLDSDNQSENSGNDSAVVRRVVEFDLPESVPFSRLQCLAHTLQLIIKPVCQDTHGHAYFGKVLAKTRKLISTLRKSTNYTQEIMRIARKMVVVDVSTRWNSTFDMVIRFIELKVVINDVLSRNGIDSLLVSEWQKLDEFVLLLQPFAMYTDILQADSRSLSFIIPALVDLRRHLTKLSSNGSIARIAATMLEDLEKRFDNVLNPLATNFIPLPAAATLLDPNTAGLCN